MPRRRWIDPSFWDDLGIGKLDPRGRLFFIGCFSNADDDGRLIGNPAYLRSLIFKYDDMTLEETKRIRDTVLSQMKNLRLYTNSAEEYLAFNPEVWQRYQNPTHHKPSKLPPPPPDLLEQEDCPEDGQRIEIGLRTDGKRMDASKNEDALGRGGEGLGLGRVRLGRDLPPVGGAKAPLAISAPIWELKYFFYEQLHRSGKPKDQIAVLGKFAKWYLYQPLNRPPPQDLYAQLGGMLKQYGLDAVVLLECLLDTLARDRHQPLASDPLVFVRSVALERSGEKPRDSPNES